MNLDLKIDVKVKGDIQVVTTKKLWVEQAALWRPTAMEQSVNGNGASSIFRSFEIIVSDNVIKGIWK